MAGIDKDLKLREEIRKAGAPGAVRVAPGLYVQISKAGTASWVYRFQLAGKRREMGLGGYPKVKLAAAKKLAESAAEAAAAGVDPIATRDAQKAAERAAALTFDGFAAEYIKAQRPGWKNAKHAQQWENTLKAYASPTIGQLAPADITTDHVLAILSPIWTTKNETAARVRNRIELILDAARAKGLRTGDNPARLRGHLATLLPKRSKVRTVRHMPALPWSELPDFWRTLSASKHQGATLLRFAILTAARTGEVINAEWQEFDLPGATWTIPANRMKARKPHRVPLSAPALAILEAQRAGQAAKRGKPTPWVFPGRSGDKPRSQQVMLMALRRLRPGVVPHGFRSTFRDWCAEETHYPRDVCEMALAHTLDNDVEAAYRRGDLLEKRRALMKDWAAYVTKRSAANVVKLKRAKTAAG